MSIASGNHYGDVNIYAQWTSVENREEKTCYIYAIHVGLLEHSRIQDVEVC